MTDKVPYDQLPLVPAVCPCGHKGKSKRPEYYRCGYCYYTRWAEGTERQIKTLEDRIAKKRAEVVEYREKAAKFKKRHPKAGRRRAARAQKP